MAEVVNDRIIPPAPASAAVEASLTFEVVKRLIDIAISLSLIVILLPVMMVVALAVRLSSLGPAIFSQARLGKDGRVFTIYKFRSMRVDAESATGPIWAALGDSRVTAVGRIIRFSRLDELPQLFNVLRGEMSLIGPRPERPEFADQLERDIPGFRKRLAVKPGITGLAQVSSGYAGCTAAYRKKVKLDLLYIKKRSLLLDLQIALKTVVVIITGAGSR